MTCEAVFGDEFDGESRRCTRQSKMSYWPRLSCSVCSGPSWGDRMRTLNDSSFANMKELRFDADDGVWRVAFAFDGKRKAILLVAGDKSGVSE